MELFKNKVGRPSNEILKKRKIFKTGIILGVIAIIIGMFSLGYFNIINLRGASYAAGAKITLNKAPIYSSATSTSKAGTKTGTFYIWDSYVKNKRIRITTSKSYVGKTGKITGWINTSSINPSSNVTTTKKTTTTKQTTTKKTTAKTFKAGEAVKLSKTYVYISSGSSFNMGKKTGTYYIYSSSVSNGRIRITSKKKYVGKGIISGWVDVKKITKTTDQVHDEENNSSSEPLKSTLSGFTSTWRQNTSGTVYVTLSDRSDTFSATSSNTSVMSVENITKSSFKLKAKSGGTATITIKSNKTNKKETRTFTVQSTSGGSGSNAIKLSYASGGTINFGAGSTIGVTLKDSSDSYTVKSSNQAIVAVTNIKKGSFDFRGTGEGTATITATSVKTGKTASLTYKVNAFKLPSTSDFGSNGKNVVKKGTYNTIPVYIENGKCDNTYVNKFIADINQFDRTKTLDKRAIQSVKAVYMVSHNTFNSTWKNLWPTAAVPGSNTNGLSSSTPYSFIIVKCDRYYSHTMAHEIGHSLDARYGAITGTALNNDLKNLYNTYNKKRSSALRTYSYGSSKEFFADSFARYRGEASWKFPADLKNTTKAALDKVVNLKSW